MDTRKVDSSQARSQKMGPIDTPANLAVLIRTVISQQPS